MNFHSNKRKNNTPPSSHIQRNRVLHLNRCDFERRKPLRFVVSAVQGVCVGSKHPARPAAEPKPAAYSHLLYIIMLIHPLCVPSSHCALVNMLYVLLCLLYVFTYLTSEADSDCQGLLYLLTKRKKHIVTDYGGTWKEEQDSSW